ELGLEQFEQRERVGGGAGETGQHLAVAAEAAHLARVGLHHSVAERDLAVAGDHDLAVAAHGDDGRGVEDVGVLAGVHHGLPGAEPMKWGWRGGQTRPVGAALAPRPGKSSPPWRLLLSRRQRRSYTFFRLARGWATS